jgi:hypothetical protein
MIASTQRRVWLPALLLVALLAAACGRTAAQTIIPLSSNTPLRATLPAASSAYYSFTPAAGSIGQTLLLSVTAATGFPSLYASNSSTQPSAATALYSASWQDGGAVMLSLTSSSTWYVAVSSSNMSACNFTVVASLFDPSSSLTSSIPLAAAVAQSSLVTGGSYRYYSIILESNATQLSIAVTQSSSELWIVVNAPGNSALPTMVSSNYTSGGAALQQLVVVPLPTAGLCSIGIWSAASTSFTISAFAVTTPSTAANNTQSVLHLPYGVVYPGFVQRNYANYFTVYVDPLQVRAGAALVLSLYSLSGDADLYCAKYAYPSPSQYTWLANTVTPLDEITIPQLQLTSGLIYCAVIAYSDSSFTFTASLQSVQLPLLLGPEDVVVLLAAADSNTLASIVMLANSTGSVVITVAAQYGATSLYGNPFNRAAGRYGSQWVSDTPQPLQVMPVVISDVCNSGGRIPGSNPPQCGINLLIYSPVASQFRLAVDVSSSGSEILVGQTFPGAVVAGGVFLLSLYVPNNFLNASLLVTMEGDYDNATLSIGRDSYNRNSSQWVVAQAAGLPVLQWSIDPTDPRLSPSGSMEGPYWALISAPVATSFSVLYTLTNASGFDTAPIQLIDGEPQYGLLPRPGQVSFFTFTPPVDGWPYSVIISCTFVGGQGVLSSTQGDGTALC